jgi:hypothetical protein
MYGTRCSPLISVTCSKCYIKKASPESAELLKAYLINLLPKSFAALSVSEPSCNTETQIEKNKVGVNFS